MLLVPLLMYVAWLGGTAGRYRDRRGRRPDELFLNSLDHSFLQHKLIDLAEHHDGVRAPSLERLLHTMHNDLGGKILALVLLQIHSCSNKVLQAQHGEQRVGAFFARCADSSACSLKICAHAELVEPLDATYLGPTFPKFIAFELTRECVDLALGSEISQGGTVSAMLAHWRAQYIDVLSNLAEVDSVPSSFLQVPCHIAKLSARGLWEFVVFHSSSRFDTDCDLYCMKVAVQQLLRNEPLASDLQRTTIAAVQAEGISGSTHRDIANFLAEWCHLISDGAADGEDRRTSCMIVCVYV
jgi:hypothetical protein